MSNKLYNIHTLISVRRSHQSSIVSTLIVIFGWRLEPGCHGKLWTQIAACC